MIQFSNFSKTYSGRQVLNIPDFTIAGGTYWLKGANGAGKSTLMRCMAGLIPYNGNIAINGAGIRSNRIQFCRQIRYVEAEPVYPGFLTGTELMKFYQDSGVCTGAGLNSYSHLFGVDAYADKATGTYSSGMLKKLSLVLCLAADSSIYMFDEPLITLDTAACGILLSCIADMAANGKTILLTSHQDMAIPGLKATVLTINSGTLS